MLRIDVKCPFCETDQELQLVTVEGGEMEWDAVCTGCATELSLMATPDLKTKEAKRAVRTKPTRR